MFGYEFVNLTPEQVAARRTQLDNAGLQAYLSSVLVLLSIYAYRALGKNVSFSVPLKHKPSALEHILRRISWTLDTTYLPEFGPLKAQLLCAAYTAWLIFLIVRNTGKDYMHVTKASGHVGVSQLPLHFLLAIKSPNSPITKATGLAHERLNAYHRLLGRVIWLMLSTHAVLYLRFFVAIHVLADRLKNWVVIYGLLATLSVNAIAVLALPVIRQRVYHQVFYRSHVVLSALLLVIVWLHVPYPRIYVGQAALFWVLNGLLRHFGSQRVEATCRMVAGDLVRVGVPASGTRFNDYVPGSHAYINDSSLGPKTPFTIVAVENANGGHTKEIHFVAKVTNGPMTFKFARAAQQGSKLSLSLEGPYGEAQQYMPELLHENAASYKFLIFAGGVGATYALPIYSALLQAHGKKASIQLFWLARSPSEASWGLKMIDRLPSLNPPQLFITGKEGGNTDLQGVKNVSVTNAGHRPNLDMLIDSLLAPKSGSKETARKNDPRKMKRSYEPVVIMSCGPSALIKDLRNAADWHVTEYGRDIRWYEEQFGFGGS